MEVATLITIAKDMKAIHDFVYGDGLQSAISKIVADIHMVAAERALENARIARNKKDRINSVITHLEVVQSAHSHNIRQYSRTKLLVQLNKISAILRQQTNVSAILGLCYAAIDEEELAMNTINIVIHDIDFLLDKAYIAVWRSRFENVYAFIGIVPENYLDEIITNVGDFSSSLRKAIDDYKFSQLKGPGGNT